MWFIEAVGHWKENRLIPRIFQGLLNRWVRFDGASGSVGEMRTDASVSDLAGGKGTVVTL